MKKFESYKKCIIEIGTSSYSQIFDVSWSFSAIKDWMLDTYCIDNDSIVSIEISSVTIYKQQIHG